MKRRCEDANDKDYRRYGGAGINIFEEWSRSFPAFLAALGSRPLGTTLDRIDTTRGYEPGNVRWATAIEQGRNRRGASVWNIRGQTFESIGDAARAFSVSEQTIYRWVNGAFDKRRNRHAQPMAGCFSAKRYA